MLDHPWAQNGLELLAGKEQRSVQRLGAIGMLGFYAGPKNTIIDENGLGDALLARLTTRRPSERWRIGHLTRPVPPGYRAARQTGDTSRMHPDVARFYEKIRLVTSGSLADAARLRVIWGFLSGEYAALAERADRAARWRPRRRQPDAGARPPPHP